MTVVKFDDGLLNVFGSTVYNTIEKGLIDKFVSYIIHSEYRKAVKLSDWLKDQVELAFSTEDNVVKLAADEIPNKENYDEQVIEVLRWIHNNITYIGDVSNWNMNEYWCTAEETAIKKTGDCEDGAILAYVLCRLKGIPTNRLLIFAGDVVGGGHCWLGYKAINYPLNFAFLDWCYYYSLKLIQYRNLFTVHNKDIFEYKNPDYLETKSVYEQIWFCFNEETSNTNYKLELRR